MRFAKEDQKKKKFIPSPSSHGDWISTNPDDNNNNNNNNNQGANGYLLNQFLESQVNNKNS